MDSSGDRRFRQCLVRTRRSSLQILTQKVELLRVGQVSFVGLQEKERFGTQLLRQGAIARIGREPAVRFCCGQESGRHLSVEQREDLWGTGANVGAAPL